MPKILCEVPFRVKTMEKKISRKGAKTQGIYKMTENEISKIIINCSIDIHKELGPGLLESVYEIILAFELENNGLKVDRQKNNSYFI